MSKYIVVSKTLHDPVLKRGESVIISGRISEVTPKSIIIIIDRVKTAEKHTWKSMSGQIYNEEYPLYVEL